MGERASPGDGRRISAPTSATPGLSEYRPATQASRRADCGSRSGRRTAERSFTRWRGIDGRDRGSLADDVERAVYYPEDDRYLLTKPERSTLEVAWRVLTHCARMRTIPTDAKVPNFTRKWGLLRLLAGYVRQRRWRPRQPAPAPRDDVATSVIGFDLQRLPHLAGTSSRSGSLRCGMNTVESQPFARLACFCLDTPIGNTRPFSVTCRSYRRRSALTPCRHLHQRGHHRHTRRRTVLGTVLQARAVDPAVQRLRVRRRVVRRVSARRTARSVPTPHHVAKADRSTAGPARRRLTRFDGSASVAAEARHRQSRWPRPAPPCALPIPA